MSLMEKIDYWADMFVSEPIDEGQGLNLLFRCALFFHALVNLRLSLLKHVFFQWKETPKMHILVFILVQKEKNKQKKSLIGLL